MDVEETSRDVERAKRGDRRAYARLVERHQRLVVAITLAITADVAASEDAAQEAFLAGWRDLGQLDNLASFGPWICQIARNRARDLVRKRAHSEPADQGTVESAPDPDPDALEALLDSEKSHLISGALEALPEDGREAIILFYREGQSVAQVAQMLEVSEDVVKKRLSRARERLRKSVEAALGAALFATIPSPELTLHVLEGIGTPRLLARLRALSKLRAVSTPIRLAGVAAAAVVIANTPLFRTWRSSMRLYPVNELVPAPMPSLVVVTPPPRAPEVKGTIVGLKDATGTANLDCGADQRTVKIEHGAFDAHDLPVGSCRVRISVDGFPDPPVEVVQLGSNEVFTLRIHARSSPAPADHAHGK